MLMQNSLSEKREASAPMKCSKPPCITRWDIYPSRRVVPTDFVEGPKKLPSARDHCVLLLLEAIGRRLNKQRGKVPSEWILRVDPAKGREDSILVAH